tara:strand:+ start:12578 stop:12703 length:126 start_codon:yes stop_codon:yes gene_type:complete
MAVALVALKIGLTRPKHHPLITPAKNSWAALLAFLGSLLKN